MSSLDRKKFKGRQILQIEGYGEAGQSNPFGLNPNQNKENEGVYVTKPQKKESSYLLKGPFEKVQGVFTQYVPGQNVFVKDDNSLVKQKWPTNSNDAQDSGLYPGMLPHKAKKKLKAQADNDELGQWVTSGGRHIYIITNPQNQQRIKSLREGYKGTTSEVRNYLRGIAKPDEIAMARTKSYDSIISKMGRKQVTTENGIRSRFNDISGGRMVVGSLDREKEVSNQIQKDYGSNVLKVDDFSENPRADGYRGIHVDILANGKPAEIQIRTTNQEKWGDWYRLNNFYKTNRINSPGVRDFSTQLSNYYNDKDHGLNPEPPTQPKTIPYKYVARLIASNIRPHIGVWG